MYNCIIMKKSEGERNIVVILFILFLDSYSFNNNEFYFMFQVSSLIRKRKENHIDYISANE